MSGPATEYAAAPATRTARLLASANSDNATTAFDGPCCLRSIQGLNAKASTIYLKLYDVFAGATPASTDTPKKTIAIPASAAFVFDFSAGYQFFKRLGYRIVTGNADNDGTAVLANDVLALNLDVN